MTNSDVDVSTVKIHMRGFSYSFMYRSLMPCQAVHWIFGFIGWINFQPVKIPEKINFLRKGTLKIQVSSEDMYTPVNLVLKDLSTY